MSLAELAEEHIRAAIERAAGDFPAFDVDSWSDEAVAGQYVVASDDEGRKCQAKLDHSIARGVKLEAGSIRYRCERLADAIVAELKTYVEAGGLIVSRPLATIERDDTHTAHFELRGLWLRLAVRDNTAALAALVGRAVPLDEPVEEVVWL